MNKLCQGF